MGAPSAPLRVVIAGSGIAGITAMMALADLGERGLSVQLVSPGNDFVLRPQLIGAPWGGRPLHVDLGALTGAFNAVHRRGTLAAVDPAAHTFVTTDGTAHEYDVLLVATGATPGIAYTGVWTVGFGGLPEALAHPSRGEVAVIVPPGTTWTLPAYQLGLLAAATGEAPVRVITPELRPLEAFGPGPTEVIHAFLARHGVTVEGGRSVIAGPDEPHDLADHVVALPLLFGPAFRGLPAAAGGYLPVDAHQRVTGIDAVYVAGDAAVSPVKQGGLAAHQAEVAAADIVRVAGIQPAMAVRPPVLRGKLVAGGDELYLRRALDDEDPGVVSTTPLWRPEASLLAWRLSRWLVSRGHAAGADPLGPMAWPATAPSST